MIKKINTEFLIYACVLSLLGSRLIVSLGFPSILNFVHLGILVVIILVPIVNGKLLISRYNIVIFKIVLIALVSSVINAIAPLNIILTLLIVLEPFIVINTYENWNERFWVKIENLLVCFSLINLIISYYQYYVRGLVDDDVRGIFQRMSSGGHLNGAFSMVMAIYFVVIIIKYKKAIKRIPLILLSIMNLSILLMCDNKQSILACFIGLVFFSISNIRNVKRFIKNVLIVLLSFGVLCMVISVFLPKALTWLNNMEYVYEGMKIKFSFIETLKNNRTNVLQLFFGFGPGMTLSRVARILPEYQSLKFLGVSYSNITQQFLKFHSESWLMQSSSLWMFYFSFASFFGDLGLTGLINMVALYRECIKKLCINQLSRYLLFVVIAHGLLFDWLEEPAFMVIYFLIIVLVGHEWNDVKGRLILKL